MCEICSSGVDILRVVDVCSYRSRSRNIPMLTTLLLINQFESLVHVF